jgi:electron transfer flavoprotein alpha subunit
MAAIPEIWVLPEISTRLEEISKLSLGLLSQARLTAAKLGAGLSALVFIDEWQRDLQGLLEQYGVERIMAFRHPFFVHPNPLAYYQALENIHLPESLLFLMGDTAVGKVLAPRLAVKWNCGVASNCVKIDFNASGKPGFYRPTLNGQAYQEIVFRNEAVRLVTLDPRSLNLLPKVSAVTAKVELIEPKVISGGGVEHLEYLPADHQTMDVAEARVVVGAGAGAISGELFPLVEELADLLEGTLGGTRPVVDEGKVKRDRLVGQTGKTISPDLYLALGISGASHHVGGIQEARRIVSVNCDPQASIFQASDSGLVADLKEILPRLIEKIKQAKKDGKII